MSETKPGIEVYMETRVRQLIDRVVEAQRKSTHARITANACQTSRDFRKAEDVEEESLATQDEVVREVVRLIEGGQS